MSSVLLAEDEFLIRAVLVDALGDVGVECIEAATGLQVYAFPKEREFFVELKLPLFEGGAHGTR